VRKDQLNGLRIGSPVDLVAAGGKERFQARVTEIFPRGEFATWRAARVVGDHDLNTFLVRADAPVASTLEPGMTVWLELH
jgi:HlyD family secretion protein